MVCSSASELQSGVVESIAADADGEARYERLADASGLFCVDLVGQSASTSLVAADLTSLVETVKRQPTSLASSQNSMLPASPCDEGPFKPV